MIVRCFGLIVIIIPTQILYNLFVIFIYKRNMQCVCVQYKCIYQMRFLVLFFLKWFSSSFILSSLFFFLCSLSHLSKVINTKKFFFVFNYCFFYMIHLYNVNLYRIFLCWFILFFFSFWKFNLFNYFSLLDFGVLGMKGEKGEPGTQGDWYLFVRGFKNNWTICI